MSNPPAESVMASDAVARGRAKPRRVSPADAAGGAAEGAECAIRAEGLTKTYEAGRIVALNGASFEVRGGEHVAIVGPSGCGKSTLLHLIAAMDRADAGDLEVFGRPVRAMTVREADDYRAHTIGFVFQLHNLLPHLTAHENVQIPLLRGRLSPRERSERARALLERVGLGERLGNVPPTLSGGERQRVAVARALANRPRLLLADEPTGALDSKSGAQVLELLSRVVQEDGVTLVVVTHDASVAARAERVLQMRDGSVHSSASTGV